MERALLGRLRAWRGSPRRKPLVLRGARQTGKTWLLAEFGRREYERTVVLDFERDPGLTDFFRRDLDPHRILRELSLYTGQEIRPERDLVVFDEIQASGPALTSLKYFHEGAGEYHVAAAGSLLGILLAGPGSFPVGKVSFLDLDPMSFPEFLTAMGKGRYAEFLKEREELEPLSDPIHEDLLDLLRKYYWVGGMPEAVRTFAESGDPATTRTVQREILDAYHLDFAKHAPASDIPKLGLIWDSLPLHLARENRKFMFSHVRKGARARDWGNALQWLVDAGLVHLSHAVASARSPLGHYADRTCFKVYPVDVGLLGAMTGTQAATMVTGDSLFTEFRGALTETFVAQQLVAAGQRDLRYWRSGGGRGELDFLIEVGNSVVPIEAKAGRSRRSRSLQSFDQQFSPDVLFRTNLLNLKRDGRITNVPLYAASQIPRLAVR